MRKSAASCAVQFFAVFNFCRSGFCRSGSLAHSLLDQYRPQAWRSTSLDLFHIGSMRLTAHRAKAHHHISHGHQQQKHWRTCALLAASPVVDLPEYQLPIGLVIRHTSTPAEVMFLYGEQQQYLQHGVSLKRGSTVIDVGANIGLFSLLAAEAVGPQGCVISAEPAPNTAGALAINMQQHACWCAQRGTQVGRSVVLPIAVTDDEAAPEALFTVYKGASGWSTLAPDDSEVWVNMQSYLRSLLQQRPAASPQSPPQQDPSPAGHPSLDSQGWSIPQRLLVLCARQLARLPGMVSVTDFMGSWYVKLVMLRDAEEVTVPTATLSSIIEDQQLQRVDLLKVDVERAELQVLQGIQQQHWPLIQQVTMEVHDIDDRLQTVVSLLKEHGFSHVHVDQLDHLQGTDLYNLYATRPAPLTG